MEFASGSMRSEVKGKMAKHQVPNTLNYVHAPLVEDGMGAN